MQRQKMQYEVYEDDVLVDRGSSSELANRLNTAQPYITQRAKDGGLLFNRYKIKAVGIEDCEDYAEQERLIKADYDKGMKPLAISKHLGISKCSVEYRIKGMKERGEIT